MILIRILKTVRILSNCKKLEYWIYVENISNSVLSYLENKKRVFGVWYFVVGSNRCKMCPNYYIIVKTCSLMLSGSITMNDA